MKLYYVCKPCGHKNTLPINTTNRADIDTNGSDGLVSICAKCLTRKVIPLNDIRAKESKLNSVMLLLGVWCSALVGGVILLKYWDNDLWVVLSVLEVFGIGISIPFLIASVVVREERKAVKLFNNYYV